MTKGVIKGIKSGRWGAGRWKKACKAEMEKHRKKDGKHKKGEAEKSIVF